jgi:hypothetical protein
MPPGKLPELKKSSKPPGELLNACSKPKRAQNFSPLLAMHESSQKCKKMQSRASQIDKIQHRMLHMSK